MLSIRKIALASIFSLTPAVAFGQAIELIYNNTLPPFNETYQVGIRDFAAAINEASGGEIKVTIPDAQLAPVDRQYEAVRDGIVDMALIDVSAVTQHVVLNGIGELPGFAPTSEAGSVALWETYQKFFEGVGEWDGVKVLSTHVLPGRQILSVSEFVPDTPEGMRGARTWATSATLAVIAQAFGGVPMDTAYPELQENVERGNLDVLFITPGSADGAGVRPSVTHLTKIPGGIGTGSFAVIIAEERWNEMTPAQQEIILATAEGLPRRLGQANDVEEIETAPAYANVPTTEVEGEALAAFHEVLDQQESMWFQRAEAAGLADPQAAIDFYQSVLKREAGE
ncbi:hypothetical protein JHL21_16545 [Devosia sp. WQ 349]|uniref:hypothetical protein n=1 Tax=Devosia sp. WQ 349K1 TaxID=2800329 RepID=UPI001908F092|nr:hypothetical protein [Devosia sp. WQ 349K1]MBK1796099.1 hypothetical protein [Devosia sp. WQ 349K1]